MTSMASPSAGMARSLLTSFVQEDAGPTNAAGVPAAAAPSQPVASGGPILLQYASYLGMDAVADSDLLWIAQQALTAELPPGWTEHADAGSGDSYCARAHSHRLLRRAAGSPFQVAALLLPRCCGYLVCTCRPQRRHG